MIVKTYQYPRVTCNIAITNGGNTYIFDSVNAVDIDSNMETLTDTCTIALPKKISWQGKLVGSGDSPILQRGNKVVVKLGWNDDNKQQYVGYIRDVLASVPMIIRLDDSMYLLKKNTIDKSYPNTQYPNGVTLAQMLADIIPAGIEYKLIDNNISFAQFRIKKATPAMVLDTIGKECGMKFAFRSVPDGAGSSKEVLYIGLLTTQWTDFRQTLIFEEGVNIINRNDLVFRRYNDIKIKIDAISMYPNNTKLKIEAGDADGELRTIYKYNVDEPTLKAFAQNELKRYKYTGFYGRFPTFGEPSANCGDIARMTLEDGSGDYFIKRVIKHFGVGSGYKQDIHLGMTAA